MRRTYKGTVGRHRRWVGVSSAVFLAALMSQPLRTSAQEADEATGALENATVLQPLVITARKFEEDAFDVPIRWGTISGPGA